MPDWDAMLQTLDSILTQPAIQGLLAFLAGIGIFRLAVTTLKRISPK